MELRVLIIILAFILMIAVLGIFLYFYFRHEQNKVIPPDQYNEARNEYFERRNRRLYTPRIWSVALSRLLIFYSTFVGFVALFYLFTSITNGVFSIPEIIRLVLYLLVASPFILVIFPIGLEAFFVPNSQGGFVGHILYLIIFFFGIFVKDRRSFTIIYLIFIMLLFMNSRGCSRLI